MGKTTLKPVHIEAKSRDAIRDAKTLEPYLGAFQGRWISPADATTASGLPLDSAEAALLALTDTYRARLRVTEGGVLHFYFPKDTDTSRLIERRLKRRAQWRRRYFFPGIALLMLLITPFVAVQLGLNVANLTQLHDQGGALGFLGIGAIVMSFILLTCLAAVAVIYADPFAGLSFGFFGITLPLIPLISIFDPQSPFQGLLPNLLLSLVTLSISAYVLHVSRSHLRDFAPDGFWALLWRDNVWARRLARRLYALFFGARWLNQEDLYDEQRLAREIRRKEGVICLADLMEILHASPERADYEVTRILCDYGGDIIVTDEGAILYDFRSAMAQSGPGVLAGSLSHSAKVPLATMEEEAQKAERSWLTSLGGGKSNDQPDKLSTSSPLEIILWYLFLVSIVFAFLGQLVSEAAAFPRFEGWATFFSSPTDTQTLHWLQWGMWPYLILGVALLFRLLRWVFTKPADELRFAPLLRVAYRRPDGDEPYGWSLFRPKERTIAEVAARWGGTYEDGVARFPELARGRKAAYRARYRTTPEQERHKSRNRRRRRKRKQPPQP